MSSHRRPSIPLRWSCSNSINLVFEEENVKQVSTSRSLYSQCILCLVLCSVSVPFGLHSNRILSLSQLSAGSSETDIFMGVIPRHFSPRLTLDVLRGEDHLQSWELVLEAHVGLFTDSKADGVKKKKTGVWEVYHTDVMIVKHAKWIWFYSALFKSTDLIQRHSHGGPNWPQSYFSSHVT